MKKMLLLVAILFSFMANAQDPIFTPSMSITSYGIVDSPIGEEVDKIIDGDINTKFLDFELNDGMGFTVDLGGLSYTATSIEVTTANDFEVRDPVGYEVFGSNDGITYTSIASGDIPCISDRLFTRTFDFVNDISYMHYRVDYTDACDPTGGTGIPSIQVAETQLYETILGINDNTLFTPFTLYPNPVTDILTIETPTASTVQTELFDINGRLLLTKKFTSEENLQLNLSAYRTALYFIKIKTEQGTVIKRVVKK